MAAEPKFDTANCLAKWEAVKVGEKGSIPAAEFLDACDAIISIFDCLGSGLGMVKKDMVGNVTHIRNNMANFPPDVTLDAMVQKDIEAKVTHKDGTTAMSLLWLKRYAPQRQPSPFCRPHTMCPTAASPPLPMARAGLCSSWSSSSHS